MADEHEATIAWTRRGASGIGAVLRLLAGFGAVETVRRECDCPLTDDQWEELEGEAEVLLEGAS